MTPRRSRLALFLVVAVAALALSAAGDAPTGDRAPYHRAHQAFAEQTPRVDGLAVLPSGVERREPGSERSSKRRVALLAIAVALVAVAVASRRSAVVIAHRVRLLTSSWAAASARAPPSFSC
jgi:hypothetical protein